MFDLCDIFPVDFCRYVGHVDEVDVRDVDHCAAPPLTTRQHVPMDDNMCGPDMLMYSKETQILKKSHNIIPSLFGVVRSKHDVVYDVWYHEALVISNNTISFYRYDGNQTFSCVRHFTAAIV